MTKKTKTYIAVLILNFKDKDQVRLSMGSENEAMTTALSESYARYLLTILSDVETIHISVFNESKLISENTIEVAYPLDDILDEVVQQARGIVNG
jgi:hypothetical protein